MQFIKKVLVTILTWESRLIIRKYKPFIIAVTGSVGKTSTKDAIFCVIKDSCKFARKSEKSMNSEIGLPLTIIGVANAWKDAVGWLNNVLIGFKLIIFKKDYPDCLVLEIGADHPGDIKKVAKWLHPDIAVITKVSSTPVHVEFFKSPEQVFEEKSALATGIKSDGTLIIFADDEKVLSIAGLVKDKNIKVIPYGTIDSAVVRGSDYHVAYEANIPNGFSFNLTIDGHVMPISIQKVLGQVYMYPLLAAASVGKARGINSELIAKSLLNYEAPHGRMNIIQGIDGSIMIDDTYNSSPDAVMSALETLCNLECRGSKIAILGDMMELGKFSSDEHRKIGREVSRIAGRLITVEQRSRATAEEAITSGMPISSVNAFDTSIEAADFAKTVVKSGDIILIKGSQSTRMERVVKVLMEDSENAPSLLVRQEKEWLDKK